MLSPKCRTAPPPLRFFLKKYQEKERSDRNKSGVFLPALEKLYPICGLITGCDDDWKYIEEYIHQGLVLPNDFKVRLGNIIAVTIKCLPAWVSTEVDVKAVREACEQLQKSSHYFEEFRDYDNDVEDLSSPFTVTVTKEKNGSRSVYITDLAERYGVEVILEDPQSGKNWKLISVNGSAKICGLALGKELWIKSPYQYFPEQKIQIG